MADREPEAVRPIVARVIEAWPIEARAGLAAAQLRLAQQTGPDPLVSDLTQPAPRTVEPVGVLQ